jgi:YhcH/YjgK/YiaL family protein
VELHAKYVDIQAVLNGNETIYCLPTDGLEVIEEMDYARDRGFFKFAPGKETSLAMTDGTFALFLPGEGHLTGLNDTNATIRKIVFKVAIDLLKK